MTVPENVKEIILYAMRQEHCVIEFSEMDDGSMHVVDITEHVNQLEKMANIQ